MSACSVRPMIAVWLRMGEMMTQVLIGLGSGILLGLRWKFAVLYPATLLVAISVIATGGLNWSNAGLMVLVMVAVQVGYVGGVAARSLLPVEGWKFTKHGSPSQRVS